MTWGKVSDELHDDEKWRATSKGARALWTTALSWSASKGNGGRIPMHMLSYLDGTAKEAADLVRVGLWDAEDDAWKFHDWDDYNESEEVAQARKARRAVASAEANHVRWHARKGVRIDSCDFCTESDSESDSDRSAEALAESGRNPPGPVPGPVPKNHDPDGSDSLPRKRASRIPDPFVVTVEMRQWAADEVPTVDVDAATRRFVDYWRGVSGQKGTKQDWPATWRNWLRNDADRQRPAAVSGTRTEQNLAIVAKYAAAEQIELKGITV